MENRITQPLKLTIPPPQAETKPQAGFWTDDAPSFEDFLDLVNPLQHIPIVSHIYQSMTGDTQSFGAKLGGGLLFGGPLGFVSSLINIIAETATGADFTGHALALLTGEDIPAPKASQTAETTPPPEHFTPASQRSAYNAYVSVQNRVA